MNWTNAADFMAMGGYGQYVWGSFGMTVVVVCVEWHLLRQRRKAALTQIKHKLITDHHGGHR